jgi:sugar phosphate permease
MNHRHESTKQITLNPDFQIFLDSVDNDIFVGQTPVPKTKQNIMTIRQKALSKIEKLIKKESKGKDGKTSFSEEDQPFREKLKAVITNKVFVCLCMSLTGLFFVVTGIQYWTPDYLKNVLNQDDQTVSIYFSTCSLTAPVSGVIIGGIITTSYGGYNSRKAQKIQVMMGLCAMFSALPIPWMNNFYSVGILFWLLLFFGGFILPPVTGIMINSVGDYQKSSANSIANLCYNLFGFLPAPSVYGFVSSVTGGSSSRWAMGVILYSTIFTISMLFYGINEKLRQEEL